MVSLKLFKRKHYVGAFIDISKYKGLEINLYADPCLYVNLSFCIRRKQDHPGFNLDINLFGFQFEIDYYDSRHWSDSLGRLLEHGEKEPPEDGHYEGNGF